jgi:hypothetical protein
MLMAKPRKFLNFEVTDELLHGLDEAAKKSRWDRSKQARAMLEYALGIERKPYLPLPPHLDAQPFNEPTHEAPGRRRRRPRA